MMYFLIITLNYVLFSFFTYVFVYLDILSLKEIRKSLAVKARKGIDKDIDYLEQCKRLSYIWPYSLYLLFNLKNEKK